MVTVKVETLAYNRIADLMRQTEDSAKLIFRVNRDMQTTRDRC